MNSKYFEKRNSNILENLMTWKISCYIMLKTWHYQINILETHKII